MTNEFTAIGGASAGSPVSATHARGERCAVSANAAKVLETTRRAWSEASAQAPKEATRRPPRASQPKKRVVPRRSRWSSLVAALNYWSPKPL
ncbi:hypothetical protein AWB79_02988 [Caballeronia hypogeia]|uniref:Uncharacterized protein n=1 Tax=Caballeronia hypogeia TaxID=1777140 RepID=A0A158AZZ5_9BURK|nr:hypothetical protein [Caballeronia hypogeia]SAK63303.1 hypothetical protein AWB79_02988 [Caballeronia hypogeia]